MTSPISAAANDVGGLCTSVGITVKATTATIEARQTDNMEYYGATIYAIVLGRLL